MLSIGTKRTSMKQLNGFAKELRQQYRDERKRGEQRLREAVAILRHVSAHVPLVASYSWDLIGSLEIHVTSETVGDVLTRLHEAGYSFGDAQYSYCGIRNDRQYLYCTRVCDTSPDAIPEAVGRLCLKWEVPYDANAGKCKIVTSTYTSINLVCERE